MKKKLLLLCIVPFLMAFQNTRFMVVGDTHISSPHANFKGTVLYEIVLAAIDEQVDFIFFAGDLVVRGFSDAALEDSVLKDWRFVLDTLAKHDIRLFACRGNNDVSSKASWDSLFKGTYAFPQNGPADEKNISYALEYNNVLFIAFDQYTKAHRINQQWLDEILSQNSKPFIFAAGHEAAFKIQKTNCMAAYPAARDSMWESLSAAGAKIFFCAHDHFYDHTIIDDDDGNPHNDLHQVVVGTGSYFHPDGEYDGDNGRWQPVRQFHEQANGYVLVDVTDDQMQLFWKHRIDSAYFEDGGDSFTISVTNINEDLSPLVSFKLYQNYPNPFNSISNFEFRISNFAHVNLSIYNLLGQKVATLVNKKQTAGSYEVQWDASDFSTGVYFYRMSVRDPLRRTADFVEIKKLILIK